MKEYISDYKINVFDIGEARGEEILSLLINKLIEANRMAELKEITSNKELREKLYKEYSIK